MKTRLIYLVGQPGSGKSTLMARLTGGLVRLPFAPPETPVPHDRLVDPETGEVLAAEIGRRRELFSGTDALASSIIEKAIPWIRTVPYPFLMAEGARLGNKRFLEAAFDAGYTVTLALLDHPDADAWRKLRARQIGKTQNPAWVKGRLSASRNLADWAAGLQSTGYQVLRGHPDDLHPQLEAVISSDG